MKTVKRPKRPKQTNGTQTHAPKFTLFRGTDKRFYWTAHAGNGEPVADGAQGYQTAANARAGIQSLRDMLTAKTVELTGAASRKGAAV